MDCQSRHNLARRRIILSCCTYLAYWCASLKQLLLIPLHLLPPIHIIHILIEPVFL